MQDKLHEPSLEEYGLDTSIYNVYWEKNAELEEKLQGLEKSQWSPWLILVYALTLAVYLYPWLLLFKTVDGFWFILWFYGGLIFIGYTFNFIANIISFGRLNKIKKLIRKTQEQINELKKDMSEKVYEFEKAASDYYQTQLRDFFETNLYKKRSGSQEFEEALSEFSLLIEELSTMSSVFITSSISYWRLQEYKDYLKKRAINHIFQSSKENESLSPIRNFVRNFSKQQTYKQKKVISPERLYRIARKIDNWDEINKNRRITGAKGEEIAVAIEQEFFESIDRKDLAEKVQHVSAEKGDGLGYDVLSFFEDGREKYIEVKSTTTSLESPYYISRNELKFLQEHNDDAFIYRIFISGNTPQLEAKTSSDVLRMNEIIPIQYIVSGKSN